MAVLTVASRADHARVLPAILAATFLTQRNARKIEINYKDVKSLGEKGEQLILTTDDGTTKVDARVVAYLTGYSGLRSLVECQVTEWLQRSTHLASTDYPSLNGPVKELDAHLTLRSYIVGHSLTLADVVVWGVLFGNKVTTKLRQNSINLGRWFEFIESSNPWIRAVIAALNSAAVKRKAAASAAGESFNVGLKNTENGIVTRFPPEPSGYLHIGHAKAALLNDYFAHEYPDAKSSGTLICRFDDTNPSKESQEFQQSILEDLALLGIVPDRVSYSSDYFQQMYDACVKLIRLGKAYADNTPKDEMNEQRMKGIASVCRDISIQDSLTHLKDMKAGTSSGWCIRAKISIDDPVKCLRDPVIYRTNLQPHHRTGSTWKIYPTYDFCAPFLDSIEGVTHALRTNEYRDRNVQYAWMQAALGIRPVEIWDFSRLNFVRTLLSKRKLTYLVDKGVVSGWDDPRMPTVRGIRRRGMTIPALREFILKQGPSQNVINLDWSSLWATNKKHIDPIAPRFTVIPRRNAVTATVNGVDEPSFVDMPKHSKNTSLGTKKVMYCDEIILSQDDAASLAMNEEITLMNWGNAIVVAITTNQSGLVSNLKLRLHLDGNFKKTKKKVTWLAKRASNMIPVDLVYFDYLISKDKLEKEDDLSAHLTPQTEFRTEGYGSCNVANLSQGDIVQFDRNGFFHVDQPLSDHQPAVCFNIPTGKA